MSNIEYRDICEQYGDDHALAPRLIAQRRDQAVEPIELAVNPAWRCHG